MLVCFTKSFAADEALCPFLRIVKLPNEHPLHTPRDKYVLVFTNEAAVLEVRGTNWVPRHLILIAGRPQVQDR